MFRVKNTKIELPAGFTIMLLAIILLVMSACGGGSKSEQAETEAVLPGVLRILPLGDSITQGNSQHDSYRRALWQKLQANNIAVDFIGTESGNHFGGPPNIDFDRDHEGHWGWETGEIDNKLSGWLDRLAQPDIALIHLGSNDVFRGRSIDNSLQHLRNIIDQLRVANPKIKILLAKIIPASGQERQIQEFNQALSALASYVTENSKLELVDLNSGFDPASMTYDGAHPNQAGEAWLAEKWFQALQLKKK